MTARPHLVHRVALLGFSAFERSALASTFRLAAHNGPACETVESMTQADFVVADADTVFVGAQPPEGAMQWMMRPIDPMQVMRALESMIALHRPGVSPSRRAAVRPTPGRRASDSEPGALNEAPAAAAPERRDVLLVDDSEVALRFLERQLRGLGMNPQSVNTSAEALERLAARAFPFVILDVELGEASELDGLALCRRIKEQHRERGEPSPVVVMLSAHGEAVDRVRGTLAGCDAYLTKPLDQRELQRTLHRHGATLSTH